MNDMNKQDDVGLLIRDAGAREQAGSEQMAKARSRVSNHWQQVVAEQRMPSRIPHLQYFSIAAGIVTAIAIGFLISQSGTPSIAVNIATVNRVIGEARIDGVLAESGTTITEQSLIETSGNGRLALDLNTGQSLRIDTNTRLIARGGNSYALEHGGIYVDSGAASSAAPVFIATHLGTATDVGTQFQVRVDPTSLRIGVREGLVALNTDNGAATEISVGTLFEISDEGGSSKRKLATDDETWQWTSSILPTFETDGASLSEYLAWFSRESGLKLEWFDVGSQNNADRTTLEGSLDGLSLEEGLQAVHKIAPFDYTLTDSVITVQVR